MGPKLLSCAKIATYRMNLYNREDKMQDAILDILEKDYGDAPRALIIRIMKNKIIDDIRGANRQKRNGHMKLEYDVSYHPYFAEFEIFEIFKNMNYRNYLLAKGVALWDAKDVAKSLSMPYKTVIARFRAIKRELRRDDKNCVGVSRDYLARYYRALQSQTF